VKKMLRMMILLFAAGAVANATTYYVAKGGSDAHTGLASSCADTANAFLTIGKAAAIYAAGDTVNVCDGIYAESFTLGTNGTAGSPVIFQSVNKYGASIAPSSTPGNGTVVNIGSNYTTWKGFDVTGTTTTAVGIKCNGANHCSVIGNRVHDLGNSTTTCTSGAAIQNGTASDDNSYIGNLIINIGMARGASIRCNQQHGLYVGGGLRGTFQNNIIMQVWQGYSIHVNCNTTCSNWTISNNTVLNGGDDSNNSGGAFILDCGAAVATTCDNNTVTNNIFANFQETGRACIWERQETGATVGIHNLYSKNLEYNCAPNIFFNGNTNPGYTPGPTTDPLFVNYTGDQNGDYHLQAGSPAINAGTSLGSPSTDFDGVSRLQWDIGAYVFAVSAGTPAPPTGLMAIAH
jgi:hypothetical protein